MRQRSVKISDIDILSCYDKKMSLHETSVYLGATIVTIWRRAKKLGLSWKNIECNYKKYDKIELSSILNGEHPEYQTYKLHKRLITEGIKENKCEICGIESWNNRKLVMQLDHIDGNPHNHILSNLRMICPNCHSQTDTFCGKNK